MHAVGDLVAGKYRVEELLAQGGMGVLFLARHETLEERVVIKFVRAADLDEQALARFEREARIAVKLRTEHVARVLDAGRDDAGDPFIVMEYLDGIDLSKLVRERGPLRPDIAVEYLVQACHGLAEAHALGIVHRDVKPGNLFLAKDPAGLDVLKVLDFVISKAAYTAGEGLTTGPDRSSLLLGTPQFASPEQIMTPHAVDPRADVWSLGVTAHFLVTGELPFMTDDIVAMMARVLNAEPPPLRTIRPDIPKKYEALVLRCLQKKPEQRFRDVAELAEHLAELGSSRLDPIVEHTRLLLQRARTRASSRPPPPQPSTPAFPEPIARPEPQPARHERRAVVTQSAPPPPPITPRMGVPAPVASVPAASRTPALDVSPSTSAGLIIHSHPLPPISPSTPPPRTRSSAPVIVAGVLCVLVLVSMSIIVVQGRDTPASVPVAAPSTTASTTAEPPASSITETADPPATAAAPGAPSSTATADPRADATNDAGAGRRGRVWVPRPSATAHPSGLPSSLRGLPATRD